jgi:hypothetical protein
MKPTALLLGLACMATPLWGQHGYWQQAIDYDIELTMNPAVHQFEATQRMVYTNNSPDTLRTVFMHLYFNAFQPNSAMDQRQRALPDPDGRIGSRILALTPEEQGWQRIGQWTMGDQPVDYSIQGTVMQGRLPQPIAPGQTVTFHLTYQAQVPIQIRRSGRNNAEGVDYTMTQWYPKMAEYDRLGWHADPYIAREFHGVWGRFDVKINIDSKYVLAGTGVVQNPCEVGHGYCTTQKVRRKKGLVQWHFKAENVHDFAWAADPDYAHDTRTTADGKILRFFYLPKVNGKVWKEAQPYAEAFFKEMQAGFGAYPYPEFAFIMGGDGGMEYPNCTMLKGTGELEGMVGVMVHEAAHNWFYGILATNEQAYPWMDEGFTTFAEDEVLARIWPAKKADPHLGTKKAAAYYMSWEGREPLTTPADRFATNRAYGLSAYTMGSMFLIQLRGMMGQADFDRGMALYYDRWKFKHPEPDDFIKVMEDVSGLQLRWFLTQWTGQLATTDFSVEGCSASGNRMTNVELKQTGALHVPVEVVVTLKTGTQLRYYIPNDAIQGQRRADDRVLPAWPWTQQEYAFVVDIPLGAIQQVAVDPLWNTADGKRDNNTYQVP